MPKTETHDKNGFPLAPVDVSKTCWLYGEAAGMTVVLEERDPDGKHIRTLQALIPWDKIEKTKSRQSAA